MAMQQLPPKKRVVILGAGTAGISTARVLKNASSSMPGIEVTLVDQKNYHTVLPLVYQVVTGSVAPGHISFPVRKLLGKQNKAEAVHFRQARVQAVDVEGRIVVTDDGELGWDYLGLAMGSIANFFGMTDVEQVALPFRSLKDSVNLHNRILDNCEAAMWARDEERQRELLTFVVVGGGPTGVELAAHIQEFISKVLMKEYPSLMHLVRVILVEAQDTVLGGMKVKARELAPARPATPRGGVNRKKRTP